MNDRPARALSAAAEHPVAPFLVLAGAALLLFLRTASFELLPTWDDAEYILHNPLVTQPLDLQRLREIFTTPVMGNFAPLHILANAVQYRLWGDGPAGYHLVSAALHALNACLLFLVLGRMAEDRRVALWAALLFAVHPVNVENVAWVSEQKSLFAACFGLAALLRYLRFRVSGRRGELALSAALFGIGLLFKVSIIPLPLILAAWELLSGRLRAAWTALIPFFALAAAAAAAAVRAQMQGGAVAGGALDPAFLFGTVYPTMAPVLWRYPVLVLAPVNLSAYYDTTLHGSFLDLPVLLSLAAAAVILGLVAWKADGRIRFWVFWSCVFLLPVVNIIPLPVYYADRYLYLPAVGLFVLLGRAAHAWGRRGGASLTVLPLVAVLTATAAAGLAWSRLEVWRNDRALWEDTVRTSPGLYKPHLNLGIVYSREGRYEEAERELLASLAIRPTETARYQLAVLKIRQEQAAGRGAASR